jgi:MFS family permease
MIPGWLCIMLRILPGMLPALGALGIVPLCTLADKCVADSEIPSNLVLRKVSPKIWLPALTIMWGIVTMCLGFVRNYAGFMAVRAILGITEGGLLPGIVSRKPHVTLNFG